MPLVFVHGVATRQTPEYRAQAHQRDALFRQLVLPEGAQVFDPDWGSEGVKFDPALPWMPEPDGAEAFAASQAGAVGAAQIGIGRLATRHPDRAIDAAFEAGLATHVDSAIRTGNPTDALTAKDLEFFAAAVRYLEAGADNTAFDPLGSDAEFISALALELKPHLSRKDPAAVAMGPAEDALHWLGEGLNDLVRPLRNATSDALLRIIRRPLTEQVAFFLGDVFVYLRTRETDGDTNRIFAPIMADIAKAARLRSPADPLILVCHSFGAVILYEFLSDQAAVAKIEAMAPEPLFTTADDYVTATRKLIANKALELEDC